MEKKSIVRKIKENLQLNGPRLVSGILEGSFKKVSAETFLRTLRQAG